MWWHSQAIEDINIIPLHGDLVSIIRSAEDFKNLDDAIVRNFDIILLTTMNVIYKTHQTLKESPFGDASRQQVGSSRCRRCSPRRLMGCEIWFVAHD